MLVHSGVEKSHIKAEIHHISIAHDVLLALETHKPLVARRRHAAKCNEVIIVHNLRADEAALEVRVNLARRLRRCRPARDCPRTALILPRREEGLETK